MRKLSCKNTPQYLRSCCSPIGKNNTKDFSAQSGGSIGRAVWKWSGESRFPGAFSALLVNQRRFISLSDLFPLAPANRPLVSEDGKPHIGCCFLDDLHQQNSFSTQSYSIIKFSINKIILVRHKICCSMTNLLCDSIDFATKFEEDRKSETCSVQFKQQIKTRMLARITLHTHVISKTMMDVFSKNTG